MRIRIIYIIYNHYCIIIIIPNLKMTIQQKYTMVIVFPTLYIK